MNELPDLPKEAQCLSEAELASGTLRIRLTAAVALQPDSRAYELQAHAPTDGIRVLQWLETIRNTGDYVYLSTRGATVVLLTEESGDEMAIEAESFSGQPVDLNTQELKAALLFAIRLYENSHEAYRKSSSALGRIRELLDEQARRVARKAERHEPTSSAGILYSQQSEFIARLRSATEV